MKVLYLPLYRVSASFTVSFGRRWSLLEQLLLIELATRRRSLADLARLADQPDRLVIEALINLLRAGWIEVRSTDSGAFFSATDVGKHRSEKEDLPVQLQRTIKWMSLCVDRLTGAWMRADDLELSYESDLPPDAERLQPKIHTFDTLDPTLRELVYLQPDEALEPVEPSFKTASRPFARVEVAFDEIQGLPAYAPLALRQAVVEAAEDANGSRRASAQRKTKIAEGELRDTIDADDVLVGGPEHLTAIRVALERAKTHVIIHSCFVHPEAVKTLLPEFEKAAKRKVRVDLLWGLNQDPEDPQSRKPITDSERVLDALPPAARSRVQMSRISSGSHAKVIIYDDRQENRWISVVGSCNYLSSWFNAIEVSLRLRSQRVALQLLGRLMAAQIPATGGWPATARRLSRVWDRIRVDSSRHPEEGSHQLLLLADHDHYACVRKARDEALRDILMGCDLFGLSAETSVLVPMETAAGLGRSVSLLYQRPSKLLVFEGRAPAAGSLLERGLALTQVPNLHGKFLAWDDEALAVTSFNWMATVVEGTRARGGELGVLALGPKLRNLLSSKLSGEGQVAGGMPGGPTGMVGQP